MGLVEVHIGPTKVTPTSYSAFWPIKEDSFVYFKKKEDRFVILSIDMLIVE